MSRTILVVVSSVLFAAIYVLAAGTAFCQDASKQAPMIIEKPSPYGLEETVAKITENAKAGGWTVSGVRPLDKNVKANGGPEVLPVRLVELCNAQDAGKILLDDSSRYASVMMPCTISVYQKSDGKTYVSFVNAREVGKMFGGVIGEVMGGPVAADQDKFLEFLR